MSFSIYGFGTTLYGRRLRARDGSYVATKWFILACLPVIPLESIRLRDSSRGLSRQEYDVVEDLPLDLVQVFNTYVYVYLLVPASMYLLVIKPPDPPAMLAPALALAYRCWPILLVVLLPFILRLFSKLAPRPRSPTRR